MTLTIELTPAEEARLAAVAGQEGLAPAELLRRLMNTHIAPVSSQETTRQQKTPEQRARAFRVWAESHAHDTPLLSEEAISRESIYGERG